MKKGITFTIINKAQSLNYGEATGNNSELKKLIRANGNTYTIVSRQALRYDIVRLGSEIFGWELENLLDDKEMVAQFKKNVNIKDSVEMDLFGYMKTKKAATSLTRPAVVKISNAISLEPFTGDIDFLTNKSFADRIGKDPNLANIEQHLSYYTYTITIDLSKIGIDGDVELSNEEKSERITQLLEVIKVLSRDIRGRQENLSPLFVVGGMYDIANPFFLGRVEMSGNNIDTKPISATMESSFLGKNIKDDTYIGVVDGVFNNEEDVRVMGGDNAVSVDEFFNKLINGVKSYYGVK